MEKNDVVVTVQDDFQERIEAYARFTEWLNSTVPERFLRKKETGFCFDIPNDIHPVYGTSAEEIRTAFSRARVALAGKWEHILGNGSEPCSRCVSVVNAYKLWQVYENEGLLTEDAQTLTRLEIKIRRAEKSLEEKGMKTDRLFLVDVLPKDRQTELIYFAKDGILRGSQTFTHRIDRMYVAAVRDLTRFFKPGKYNFPRCNHNYDMVQSENQKGGEKTVVKIVSR